MTMIVFTFVLLVANALQQLLPLLVKGQATFLMICEAFALLIPFVFAFALPTAMLTSTVLTFERFSGDQELTAARASGISLVSLCAPILVLSLFLCGVSAAINMYIAPACRVAYNGLRFDMKSTLANFQLPEGYTELSGDKPGDPSYTIYTRRNRNQYLQDVMVCKVEDETNSTTVIAPTGHISVDATNQLLILTLTNATTHYSSSEAVQFGDEMRLVITNSGSTVRGSIATSDMTFTQLQQELRRLNMNAGMPLKTVTNAAAAADPVKRKKALQKTLTDLSEPIRIQLHKQLAFSFACFGFTLIGIPLGIRVQRRETKIGVIIAIGLMAVYYATLVVGQSLAAHAEYAPHLLMWVPNLVFQAVGGVLLWRANRGI